ncbi:PEP/pyruvate-binding domain-containing protein [Promineifilum sp.]|uniref:PEP/pyruvate-binding domain-containing protein n=1 Tax=Promineifilum sp. TaxID=2664178 RepID=UPI0035B3E65C
MTDTRPSTITPAIDVYVKLAQFPILADRVRERMRQELFRFGVVEPDAFELEVREQAMESQRLEGLGDPYYEEDSATWQLRLERIRDFHTDAYFADNFGSARLDALLDDVLNSRPAPLETRPISFNPEIAPWEMLFQQGEIYERMPSDQLENYGHHLEEIKVVLIKRLMSDQLPFIGVAKRVLRIADLRHIYQSLIGTGKIGGKASGMILAVRILQEREGQRAMGGALESLESVGKVEMPDSYFVGTDAIYEFFLANKLEHFMNQKYRSVREIREQYPVILEAFLAAELPDYLMTEIREVVQSLGDSPLIVRSSSLLEDNFGFAFAGKYNSFFCANQGTLDENVACVLDAIKRIYASSANPDALLYRKRNNLIDYDERMAILLQRVTGQWRGRYFYPDLAGVGFSRHPFPWSPDIRADEGFLRLVTGLGTRAVDRVSQDYPRLMSLSHPRLRPEDSVEGKRNFAQRFMAAVDRISNTMVTVAVREGLASAAGLRPLVASLDLGDRLAPLPPDGSLAPDQPMVMTFDGLADDPGFVEMMREVLQRLEEAYRGPVDMEFAINVEESKEPAGPRRVYHLSILECRPLYRRAPSDEADLTAAAEVATGESRQLFCLPTLLPAAAVRDIEYLVFIDPECYYNLENEDQRQAVAQTVTALNDRLPAGRFGLLGPGRWGSQNSRLSVPVTYSDICNSRLLIEISPPYTPAPEFAYGTDFFEDVVEAGIFVLGIQPTEGSPTEGEPLLGGGVMDWQLLRESPNKLSEVLPRGAEQPACVRVIDLRAVAGTPLQIVIDDETREAIACFQQ